MITLCIIFLFTLIDNNEHLNNGKMERLANDRDETLNRAGKINRNSWRGPKIKASVRLRAWRRTSSSQDRLERGNVVAYVRKRLSFRSPVHWATRIDVSVHRLSVEADITPFAPAKSAYNTFSKKYYIAAPRPCKYSPSLIVFSLDFDPNNPFRFQIRCPRSDYSSQSSLSPIKVSSREK